MTWWDSRDGDYEVYFTRFSSSGIRLSPEVRVSTPGTDGSGAWFPDIAWNGLYYATLWRKGDSSPLYLRRITATGNLYGDTITAINTNNGVITSDGNSFGIYTSDSTTPRHTQITVFSGTGNNLGTLQANSSTGDSIAADIAFNGSGYDVLWNEAAGSDSYVTFGHLGCLPQ
jgi:hypothetical protein